MYDQTNIGFVNAHTERIGSRDHTQLALFENMLHVLFIFRWQFRMKMLHRNVLHPQKISYFLGLLARCTIDYGSARNIGWHVSHQYLMDMCELFTSGCRHNFKRQIGTFGTAVKNIQFNANLPVEVINDILLNIGLGSRSQA